MLGNSENILKAAEVAKARGLVVVAMTGSSGKFREIADSVIESPTKKASIMQKFHLHAIHLICESFEEPLTIES